MIEFKTLTFRNFMSYGNNITTIELTRPGTTLIVGEDLDNTAEGKGGNGTGKSSIINALTYAIYDKPISKISKDNLINNINKKNMEVILEYVGDNGRRYKIHRTRKTKAGAAGNNVYFFEDGEDKTLDSIDATNTRIEQTIGIPYELFVRIIVFSASHIPFLDLKTDDQKDIIEELFGITAVSEKAELLKQVIKDTKNSVETKKIRIQSLESEHGRHTQQIDNAKKRVILWDTQNTQTIQTLKSKLERISTIDFDQQQTLHATLAELNRQLTTASDDQRSIQRSLREQISIYTKAEEDLKHLRDSKCPYCLQQYGAAKNKITDTESTFDAAFVQVELLSPTLESTNTTILGLTERIKDVKKQITVTNIEELLQIKNESDNITHKIQELSTTTNPFEDPLLELVDIKLDPIDYAEINNLVRIIEHQDFLLKLLTKKDSFVRKELLNNNIPYLNTRLQYYLAHLGLPHKVEFTREMTAVISQFGRDLDFGNLSAGQRARVNFALSMAFRDVLQRHHPRINVCMLDEVLDIGLDKIGVRAAAKLVKMKARDEKLSMYVISHRDEIDSVFDHKLVVQLSKSFSYIVEEST